MTNPDFDLVGSVGFDRVVCGGSGSGRGDLGVGVGVDVDRILKFFFAAASMVIAAGADVKVVQRMLGHADASMTLNTYADLWPDRFGIMTRSGLRHFEHEQSPAPGER